MSIVSTRAAANCPRIASAQTVNPSYLVVSRDRNYVYAVNELPGDNGPATQRGGVSAFRFDRASGQLSFLNRVSSDGNDPCYLALSPDGKYLLTANYSVASNPGGSFAVFPLSSDGHVGSSVLTVHHEGGGPVKGRQDNSHVHSTVFSPDGKYLFAQDLGVDKVFAYRYTPDPSASGRGLFGPTEARYTPIKPGSGPRHLIFDASGRHAYLTTELNASVLVFDYRDGKLTQVQTNSMIAPGFRGKIGGGAIHMSPDGRFLYATNRGDANEIVAVLGRSEERPSEVRQTLSDARQDAARIRDRSDRALARRRQSGERQRVFLPPRSADRRARVGPEATVDRLAGRFQVRIAVVTV